MVFVPLSDENPRLVVRYPYVAWTLIALNLGIYILFQSGLAFDANEAAIYGLGVIPAVITGSAQLPAELHLLPAGWTLLTSPFLHGDPLHLIGNMLFLFVFGDNIEDSMGHARFALFYFLCGAAGAGAHILVVPYSEAPLIGASGAIAGIVASYLLLHPRVKMWILLFGRIPLKVTAFWIIGAWAVVQIASTVVGNDASVGWWAHIGGFVAGAALTALLKRPDVPWFGRPPKTL